MGKPKGDIKSEEEGEEGKRVELLKRKARRLKCPVCGAPARLRVTDGAIICRDGGHSMTPEGDVTLPGGVKTTMKELREKGVDLYIDREKGVMKGG